MQTALNTATLGQSVVYIDTCNSFSMGRLRSVCTANGGFYSDGSISEEFKDVLSKIQVVPVFDPYDLFDTLQAGCTMIGDRMCNDCCPVAGYLGRNVT